MARCKTCGATIAVPEGWSVGPAVRKHYWEQHPERMERARPERDAETTMPPPGRPRRSGGEGPPGKRPSVG